MQFCLIYDSCWWPLFIISFVRLICWYLLLFYNFHFGLFTYLQLCVLIVKLFDLYILFLNYFCVFRICTRTNLYDFWSTLFTNISGIDSIQGNRKREKEINSLHSSTKNHNLQQYLQNTLSTLLNRDKNLSCLFVIKQLGSSISK